MVIKVTKESIYWFGLMLYVALSNTMDALPAGQVLLLADLLLIGMVSVKRNTGRGGSYFTGLQLYVIAFTAFCFASVLWAEIPEYVTSKAMGVLVNCGAVLIISLGYNRLKNINKLLKTIMYGYYLAVIIAIVFFGPSQLISMVRNSERIEYAGASEGGIERNTIGMVAAYAIVINAYFLIYQKKFHVYDFISLPALILILATGSRKAMVIAVAGIVGIVLFKNWSKRNFGKSVIKVLAVLIVIAIALVVISRLPMFSGMMDRLNDIITALNGTDYKRGNSAWIRFEYMALGMQIFRQNPLLGIGLGNTNEYTQAIYGHFHYLHNNYVELLAATGIIGTVLYYSIYAYILGVFIKHRKRRNAEYDTCLILLITRLVMDFGAVFFYSKEAYIFLILFWFKARQLNDQYSVKRRRLRGL